MNKQYEDYQNVIENIMERELETRNNDRLLTALVYAHYATKAGIELDVSTLCAIFACGPAPETIKHIRARIQNSEKRLLPTRPDVIAKRNIHQKELREFYRGASL